VEQVVLLTETSAIGAIRLALEDLMVMGLVGWWFKKLFFTGLRIGTTEHFVDIVFMVIIWCHRLLFFLAVSLLSRQHLLL